MYVFLKVLEHANDLVDCISIVAVLSGFRRLFLTMMGMTRRQNQVLRVGTCKVARAIIMKVIISNGL